MNMLVIGGTRFIGPEVVRRLLHMGHDVAVFHRGQTVDDRTAGARHIFGDRKHLKTFRDTFEKFRPDIVLDMMPKNADDGALLVHTFRDHVERVVIISSGDVYLAYGRLWKTEPGPILPTPLSEDAPLRESDLPYGDRYDKIGVEQAVSSAPDITATILRLPMVYGRGDPQRRLYPYLKRMDDHRPAILLGEFHARWKWSRGYVENVAWAICLAVTDRRAAGRIYNIGEEPVPTESEWIRNIARCVGWRGEIVSLPNERLPKHLQTDYDFSQHMDYSTECIRHELDYSDPVSREEAMIRTVEWERAHPPAVIDPADYDYDAEDSVLDEIGRGNTR